MLLIIMHIRVLLSTYFMVLNVVLLYVLNVLCGHIITSSKKICKNICVHLCATGFRAYFYYIIHTNPYVILCIRTLTSVCMFMYMCVCN